ncbi:uncharacterized protein [Montipora foliosa]|uniref:uncharacterized protein n=1 Tax=Montipora foliosa TaxID=591990 RepID=UPI0035F1DECA
MEVENKEKGRNIFCFFFFGMLSLIYDEICLIAAEDILAGSTIATTVVIISIAIPVLVVKLAAPWFFQRISYFHKICLVVTFFLGGLVTLVVSPRIPGRLAGVSIVESGVATSEITLLSLTAYYEHITVSAFVAGVGVSSFVGPLYYTSLTTWTCVSPRTAIMITIPWPALFFVLYALLDKEPVTRTTAPSPESQDISQNPKKSAEDTQQYVTFADKIHVAKDIFPYIIFLFITYFSEYLSNHAIITTIAFPNAPFRPRDHYPYYLLSYHIGKFLGRSHLFLVSAVSPGLVPYIKVSRTWILALISFLHCFAFVLASWFRFVPCVEIIIALCATEGFTAGSMYLNSAHTVSDLISNQTRREFALSLLTVGNACGKLTAGLIGLFQERILKKHCIEDLKLGEYCLTRHAHTAGWIKNLHC